MSVFLFASLSHVLAQDTSWPPKEWRDSVHCERRHSGYVCLPSCKGNLIMKSGDTLKDRYMRIWANNTDVLDSLSTSVKVISNPNIKSINVNKSLFENSKIELIHIDKINTYEFWRPIKESGRIKIYDLVGPNTFTQLFGWRMILIVDKENPVYIYNANLFKSSQKSCRKKIIEFINKRYNQNFTTASFKIDMDMIDYILDKENKKSNTPLVNSYHNGL